VKRWPPSAHAGDVFIDLEQLRDVGDRIRLVKEERGRGLRLGVCVPEDGDCQEPDVDELDAVGFLALCQRLRGADAAHELELLVIGYRIRLHSVCKDIHGCLRGQLLLVEVDVDRA